MVKMLCPDKILLAASLFIVATTICAHAHMQPFYRGKRGTTSSRIIALLTMEHIEDDPMGDSSNKLV